MTAIRAFNDREHAGLVLADELRDRLARPCVVVAIPRGGILVGAPIAERFACALTLCFARKLTLLDSPELAFGAMDEDSHVVMDHDRFHDLGARPSEIAHARERTAVEIQRQQRAFPVVPLESFLPRSTVVLVDDGLATGYTMRAALARVRRRGARRIVVAVPCASSAAAATIRREADDFVCPLVDDEFTAVGAYYLDFPQVTDLDVREALDRARARTGTPPANMAPG